ncbi:MAG: response regulator [Lachnospiraceae bacterium]|jgi:DNA-binding LytR/AlgR family response regulator|nr:response regulator [Lachnospiraceae bacterium]
MPVRILVIDDEKPLLHMMTDTLHRVCSKQDEIVSFSSAKELRRCEDRHFDVAFIDVRLGNISGVTFAKELLKDSPKCNIIYVTADDTVQAGIFSTRPSGYILKPYTDEEIRAELDNLRYPVSK